MDVCHRTEAWYLISYSAEDVAYAICIYSLCLSLLCTYIYTWYCAVQSDICTSELDFIIKELEGYTKKQGFYAQG